MTILNVAINSGNAALVDCPHTETARILRKLADRIEQNAMPNEFYSLHDINGNRVGTAHFDTEADE